MDDEEGSDYINANYVPGHNSPREFIVTQGPLHSTRDDFWRMCWESNSRAIVMLTRTFEKGREKCDHYWPHDTVPVYYGDIKVTLLNDSHYPDWVITEFMMTRGDQQRILRHFHFTTWPDFGVPNPPQTLARFVRAFRERVGPDQRPIVVHCSAGVGRSGTFITLDRILQQIQVSDYVDIFGIVWAMRKERVWMVQTEQQYICVHQCLLVVLEGQEGTEREIHDNQGYEEPGEQDASEERQLIEAEGGDTNNEGELEAANSTDLKDNEPVGSTQEEEEQSNKLNHSATDDAKADANYCQETEVIAVEVQAPNRSNSNEQLQQAIEDIADKSNSNDSSQDGSGHLTESVEVKPESINSSDQQSIGCKLWKEER